MLVSYVHEAEVLVCEANHEQEMLLEWFTKDGARDQGQYSRVTGSILNVWRDMENGKLLTDMSKGTKWVVASEKK